MQIELIIKDKKILDFGYQGKSCVYCQASASLLSKISINHQKEKINDLCDNAEFYFDDTVKITDIDDYKRYHIYILKNLRLGVILQMYHGY